jgi:hypothetical protein
VAHNPTTKPAKPAVTAVRVRTVVYVATATSLFSLYAAWQVQTGQWTKVGFDLTLMVAALLWIAAIATGHARHVTLYIRECATLNTLNGKRQTHDLVRRNHLADEVERYLRAQEN